MAKKTKSRKRTKQNPKSRVPRSLKYNGDVAITLMQDSIFIQNDSLQEVKIDHPFALNKCDGGATWIAKYDQYRIDKVEATFRNIGPTVINRPYDDTTAGNTVNATPRWVIAVDYDAGDVNFDYDSLKNRSSARHFLATAKDYVFTFRPTPLLQIYNSTLGTAYAPDTKKRWLDSAYAALPHYGLKGVMEAGSPNGGYQWTITYKYYITFHDRKS